MEPSKDQRRTSISSGDAVSSPQCLRILIVEDRETDTELIVRELKKHGFEPHWTRVDQEEQFLAELAKPYDLVTADAIMPQFSALRVVELLQSRKLDIPCIVISGSIGEEEAVALIRAGASDYLMKDRLGRLGQAIRQVCEQQNLRTEHRRAHEALILLNTQLEHRIGERTAELERLNENLAQELAERHRVETLLREHEAALERHVARRTEQLSRSHQRLRRLSSQLTLVEHQERKRLAADLHDYLAQLLVVAQFKTAHLKRLAALPEPALPSIKAIEEALSQSLTFTRTLVSQLSPTVLARQGLVAGLKELSGQMRHRGLEVEFQSNVGSIPLSEQQAVLLYQSVRELLINVSKHAQASAARIEVKYELHAGLVISVSDNGCGFDLDAVSERTTGFGIFSVQERLEGLGGKCEISTTPGLGTRVLLTLPANMICENSSSGWDVSVNGSGLDRPEPARNYRVLVVDDHRSMRLEVSRIIQGIPTLQVVGEAMDGRQAVSIVDTLLPDLIIMDIQMPNMDGIEASKTIKSRYPGIFIIGISAHYDQILHQRMRDAGAVTTLVKDNLPSEVADAISHLLRGIQKIDRLPVK